MHSILIAILPFAVANARRHPQKPLLAAVNVPNLPQQIDDSVPLLTDINTISHYWGQLTPYSDNDENYFGVQDVGLPSGCQIEQAHLLQRHANRFPGGANDDGGNNQRFAKKVTDYLSANSPQFTGPLAFLNTYHYELTKDYLTGFGAMTEFLAGVTFWARYGRILYDASVGQLAYNASFPNGSARPKPVLRTTSESRILNSEINWSLGFFGPSFKANPDPGLNDASSPYHIVVIPEGGTENNTLASYDSCSNCNDDNIGYLGDIDLLQYAPKYLTNATARIQQYAPSGFNFTTLDTYAMQSSCAYETSYIGTSDFCYLFTQDEWASFESSLEMLYYYSQSWGNPTGRAQGLGYVQELLARLQNQYITTSNSSINSTFTNNPTTFPLSQPFYADFSHDTVIVAVLTALSLDYLHVPPSLSDAPPDPSRPFILSHIVPFGARLVTEVIGCASSDPEPVSEHRTQYYPSQYGYDADNATNKFIRMRLNNGILPLESLRGGACVGRSDGMCAKGAFLESQEGAEALANYAYACFGNYTIADPTSGRDYDGTISA